MCVNPTLWTSNNRQKSIVHLAGRLIGIAAQSDRLLDPEIDRYNTTRQTILIGFSSHFSTTLLAYKTFEIGHTRGISN